MFQAMQQQGIVPNSVTYSFLISACEKGKQPEQPKGMFQARQHQDIVPDVVTYNALISACKKGRQPERA